MRGRAACHICRARGRAALRGEARGASAPAPPGRVRTKSVYAPKERGDGIRVLVTRFYPRGVKKDHFDRWCRDLAPGAQLLREYRGGFAGREAFCAAFRGQLRGGSAASAMAGLRAESRRRPVTLLCYEPSGAFCHRHLLREILADPSLIRKDFEPGYDDPG